MLASNKNFPGTNNDANHYVTPCTGVSRSSFRHFRLRSHCHHRTTSAQVCKWGSGRQTTMQGKLGKPLAAAARMKTELQRNMRVVRLTITSPDREA